jgi:SAM-dependent methyltransferase
MSDNGNKLKDEVRAFWQANPCGTKFTNAEMGSREFYERVAEHRYATEWHIPSAAAFGRARGLRVLEIGCGLGTDGAQFARAGADYTGVDLTDAAVSLARKCFEVYGLRGEFRTADAENLDFADESFDLVYSHGVLHHTPDTARAVREVHRVLRPGGRAAVMLYHRNSYNYRVNINVLRRAGAHLLKHEAGLKLAHRLTGEPLASLREHAARVKADAESYLAPGEFLNRNTDGAGNPLARVYSRREARELFRDFAEVETATHFLNKRWLPLVGNMLSRGFETRLAARWGWHLWIYARKGGAKTA